MSDEIDPALIALDVITQTVLKGINCSVETALILKGHLDTLVEVVAERDNYLARVVWLEKELQAASINARSLDEECARLQEKLLTESI